MSRRHRSAIVLTDGESTRPLTATALVMALVASLPQAQQAAFLARAQALQDRLERGDTIRLQVTRIVRPEDNGSVTA